MRRRRRAVAIVQAGLSFFCACAALVAWSGCASSAPQARASAAAPDPPTSSRSRRAESALARVSVELPAGWDALERGGTFLLAARPPAPEAFVVMARMPATTPATALLERLHLSTAATAAATAAPSVDVRVGGRPARRVVHDVTTGPGRVRTTAALYDVPLDDVPLDDVPLDDVPLDDVPSADGSHGRGGDRGHGRAALRLLVIPADVDATAVLASVRLLPPPPAERARCFLRRGCGSHARRGPSEPVEGGDAGAEEGDEGGAP